jgi:hypothetical protein
MSFLEVEGMGYAIRLPANRVLQEKIGYLLKRPVGRPSHEVRRYYGKLRLSGAELEEAPASGRQGRVASGRALSARRLHRHQPDAAGGARRRLLQPPWHRRAVDQGRQKTEGPRFHCSAELSRGKKLKEPELMALPGTQNWSEGQLSTF